MNNQHICHCHAGAKVFFIKVVFEQDVFEQTIHIQGGGIGFLKHLFTYGIAESSEQAEQRIRRHFEAQGVAVKNVSANVAYGQDIDSYDFPESMVGCSGTVH